MAGAFGKISPAKSRFCARAGSESVFFLFLWGGAFSVLAYGEHVDTPSAVAQSPSPHPTAKPFTQKERVNIFY